MWKYQTEGISIGEVPMEVSISILQSPSPPPTPIISTPRWLDDWFSPTFPISGAAALEQGMEGWATSEGLPTFQSQSGIWSALLPAWWLGLFRTSTSTLGTSEFLRFGILPGVSEFPSDLEESLLSGVIRAALYHLSSRKNIWNCKAVWKEPIQRLRGQGLVRYNEHYHQSRGGSKWLETEFFNISFGGRNSTLFLVRAFIVIYTLLTQIHMQKEGELNPP